MAVGCQIGKLSGPEARPGSRLVPGVREAPGWENARNEGVAADRRREAGGRKVARRGRNWTRTCLKGTQVPDIKDAENSGKPVCPGYCGWVSNRQVGRPRKSAFTTAESS